MDPISIGLGVVGLGMSIFGGMSAADDARHAAEISGRIAGFEREENEQKKHAMELKARRDQMEIVRNNQRARARALQSATSQGAQFGSGLQGGLAQVRDQSTVNANGVMQNLEIGENIFAIDDKISTQKMELSKVQGQMATDQGIASLGGSIMKVSGSLGNLSKGFGGGSSNGGFGGMPWSMNTGGLY